MKSLLVRAFVTLRAWVGLNDPVENRMHADHGWLLPPLTARAVPVPLAARAPAPARD